MLLAFALRVAALEAVPPGPRFDEILVFMEADRIQAGDRPIYSENIYEEPLFHYLLTGAIGLLGQRLVVGRWLAAAFGIMSLATLYPLARRAAGKRAALIAVALMAVGFWPVLYSRFALRLVSMLPFVTAAVYLFWRGVERPASQDRRAALDLAMAGVSLGLGVYTYAFGRYTPALLAAFALYLAAADWRRFKQRAALISAALAIVVVMDAPLLHYLQTHPGIEQRQPQISAPLDALLEGDPGLVVKHAWRALTMPVWKGDPEWLYNISGRPVFDPATGALFYVGLAVCLVRWRQLWRGMLLAWLAVGVAPALFTIPPASFNHTIAAQPVFYLLAAIGIERVLGIGDYASRFTFYVLRFTLLALLAFNLGLTLRDLFITWPAQSQVRAEYQASLTDLARYLETHQLAPAVAGGALIDVWNPSNSYGFDLIYRRPDRPVVWYNPTGALAWPPGSNAMTVALPRVDRTIPELAPELAARFFKDAQLLHDEKLPGGQRVFKLYQARGRAALDERLAALGAQHITMPGNSQTMTLPVNLDNRFTLLGYEALSDTLRPGQTLSVITYWETRQLFQDRLIAFTHLIDSSGALAAQDDRLDVFTDSLYPGAAFAQLHRLDIPAALPPGRYAVQVGMFRLKDQARLPFLMNGQPGADAAQLLNVTINQ